MKTKLSFVLISITITFSVIPTAFADTTTKPVPTSVANADSTPLVPSPALEENNPSLNAIRTYLQKMAITLDLSLNASLAGLALAGAAFLLPLSMTMAGKPNPAAVEAANAARSLVYAFYAFIVCIITSMLQNPAALIGIEWLQGGINLIGDATGLVYMFKGANAIKKAL
jgi:hypothetical protein